MSNPWPIRAVQMDLARQKETLPTIRHFIEFAAAHGYNTLHLYLEGRVRTPSFPYPAPEDSYSVDDMRTVVEHAGRHGLDVIPQVNAFGHAHQILHYPALASLAELREGVRGRFGWTGPGTFCPSLETSYTFLERYLPEVASAFPSPYFAVGCDEVWDIGFCPRCRERLARGETQADLFVGHIRRLHAIVTGRLGKRMMMWDDMFEVYPQAFDRIPPDIIQLVWQYDELVDQTRSHFGRRQFDHRMADYRRRGTDSLICPTDWHPRNADSFTIYADPYRPLGGLLTVWEPSRRLMLSELLTVAFVGRRWQQPESHDGLAVFDDTCRSVFGISDAAFTDALRAAYWRSRWPEVSDPLALMRGPVTPREHERATVTRLLRRVLEPYAERAKGPWGREVLDDVLLGLRREAVMHGLRGLAADAADHWAGRPASALGDLRRRGAELRGEIRAVRAHRARQWAQWREGLDPPGGRPLHADIEDRVAGFLKDIETPAPNRGVLSVSYALADYYGAQCVRWEVRGAEESAWREVATGTPKPMPEDTGSNPFFTMEYSVAPVSEGLHLAIETWGYGGIGLRYVEVRAPGLRLVPRAISAASGPVRDPERALSNDTYWCTLGEEDWYKVFLQPDLGNARSRVEIALGPA